MDTPLTGAAGLTSFDLAFGMDPDSIRTTWHRAYAKAEVMRCRRKEHLKIHARIFFEIGNRQKCRA